MKQKSYKEETNYPRREDAYTFVTENGQPFVGATVGITYPLSNYKIYLPKRKESVIEYVLSGEGEILLNGKWHKVEKGDTYILFQGSDHEYRANPKNPFKKIWINYRAEYLPKLAEAYGISEGIYKVDTLQCFEKLYEVFKGNTSNVEFIIADYVYQIIKAIVESKNRAETLAQRVKNELDSAIYKKLNLDETAKNLFSSKSNIIRVFKSEYGVTPYEYLIDKKIAFAKILLTTTQMSVKEIAEKVCILDEHYFSSVFLKRVGLRPKDYRKNCVN